MSRLRRLFRRGAQHSSAERGQILLLFAGGLVAFLGIVSLGVDAGLIVYTRTNLQKGADASVLAGIQELSCGATVAERASAEAVAKAYAKENVNNIDGLFIEASGNSVRTSIKRNAPSIFASALGINAFEISAQARADVWCNSGGFGIIALNKTKCNALDLNGSFTGFITNGDIIVNSNCKPNAIDVEGSSGSITADGVYTAGYTRDPGETISPPPVYLPPVPDPYASIDTPTTTGLLPIYTDCTWGGGAAPGPDVPPGTYDCPSGFEIEGAQTVTFAGGEYVFIGGMTIGGNGGLITFGKGTYSFLTDAVADGLSYTGGRDIDGTAGVLFYNTCADGGCGTYVSASDTCTSFEDSGRFLMAGNGSVDISPYSGNLGDFSNVVFFQDRCSTTEMKFTGSSLQISVQPTGAIYGKSAHLNYAGSAGGSLQLVADTIEIEGTANMVVDVQNGETVEVMTGWALTE